MFLRGAPLAFGLALKRDLKSKKGADEGNEVNILSVIYTDKNTRDDIHEVCGKIDSRIE